MRMGIVAKRRKASSKKPYFQDTPPNTSIVIGQISSNLITHIFTPKLTDLATLQSEVHAAEILQYNEAQRLMLDSEVPADDANENNTTITAPSPEKPLLKPPKSNLLFTTKEDTDEFISEVLLDTSNYFTTQEKMAVSRWKVGANAAKFERLLNQKYGRFRPFITRHPEIEELIRNIQRKITKGQLMPKPFRQGNPPIDRRTSIIILFMMYRNGVRFEVTLLSFLFLIVGLQPWVVVTLTTIGHFILMRRRRRRVKGWYNYENKKTFKPYYAPGVQETLEQTPTTQGDTEEEIIVKAKHEYLLHPVGKLLTDTEFQLLRDKVENYDTLIIGSGPATLYTAALLSRTGRTVLVLCETEDASGMQVLPSSTFGPIPVDVESHNIAHTHKMIPYLAPALVTEKDTLGGIRLARVGTAADGYTSDILSVPGMGVDSSHFAEPYLLRAGGIATFADDAATYLADGWTTEDSVGNSTSAAYMTACSSINDTASEYFLSKLLPHSINGWKKDSPYHEAGLRYASSFLDKLLPLNAHVRSLMAAIGMRNENLAPSKTSMAAHITNVCSFASTEGFTYPVGGPRALCHALATVVEQCGGSVITGAKIKEFHFDGMNSMIDEEEQKNESKGKTKFIHGPRCSGVRLHDGRELSLGLRDDSAIISMMDFISTFILHTPDCIRVKYGVPTGLTSLTERRPLWRFLFGLRGNCEQLQLTGADWYRLPNASIARDEVDSVTGAIQQGLIGEEPMSEEEKDTRLNETKTGSEEKESKDESEYSRGKRNRKNQGRKVKFDTGKSWMKISFPSAKDPSWKQRHGDITTCVVTIEVDDDFCQLFDSNPKVFSCIKYGTGEIERLMERVKKDLFNTYPQLEGKIDSERIIGPIRMGLSHSPERYAAKGIRPITHYPGLYMGGTDLTVGDSFSGSIVAGWMAANAVVGYKSIDYMLIDKNITNDLIQYQMYPEHSVDIAVPFDEFKNSDTDEHLSQISISATVNDLNKEYKEV